MPAATVRLPSATWVQWKNQRFAPGLHPADAAVLVELGDTPLHDTPFHQCTILEMGSSMMSVAPWSFRAGMSVLMSDLGTTVSTA